MSIKSKKSLFKKGKKKTQKMPSLTKKTAKGAKTVLAIRHARHEHLGTMEEYLKSKKIKYEYLDVDSKKVKFPDNPSKYLCVIALGGPKSVLDLDDDPVLQKEIEFIKKVYEKKVACIGFCLGAQLMAKAFGGDVVKGAVKEVGWYTIRLTRDGMRDPLMIGFDSEPNIFQWHEDAILLPKDAPTFGGTLIYPNQAFRINAWTYGFQFHFEMTEKMIQDWLKKGMKELKKVKGYIDPKKIREESRLFAPSLKQTAWRFYDNLFEYLGHVK